ncbi:MAG: hypothetical protein ACOVLB_06125, partial [Candidatus Nanopelagicus sp.]
MRANEFITELFEPETALPLEWSTQIRPMPNGFEPRPVTIAQHIDEEGKALTINFYPYADNKIVEIRFDYEGSMQLTGGGNAIQRFATVIDAINKYIEAQQPEWISFSASAPKLANLYKRIINRLSSSYQLLNPKQYPHSEELEDLQKDAGTFFLL